MERRQGVRLGCKTCNAISTRSYFASLHNLSLFLLDLALHIFHAQLYKQKVTNRSTRMLATIPRQTLTYSSRKPDTASLLGM